MKAGGGTPIAYVNKLLMLKTTGIEAPVNKYMLIPINLGRDTGRKCSW
jgi:hypothetical protein